MSSKQEVSRTRWKFNVSDEVERIDDGRRAVICSRLTRIPFGRQEPIDCVYEVRYHDNPVNGTTTCRQSNLKIWAPDETDAASYVETSARGLIGDLRALITAANSPTQVAEAKLEDLEIGAEFEDGYLVDERNTRERAGERLHEMPLAVEATTTFEVVLGTGGPDRRLCFECARGSKDVVWHDEIGEVPTYEIRRVLYRYSWEGSAEVELTGEDRETAEAFGRRVVPELEVV